MNARQLPMRLPAHGKLETAFWEFHRQHPEVYRYLVSYALQWRARRGAYARVGMKALMERVRWEVALESGPRFKLNNNHGSFYARLLMEREPELRGIFALRRQRVEPTFGPGNDELLAGGHAA